MNDIRFTVIDESGATSFMGPSHAIKMLTAACSRSPRTTRELLRVARDYDRSFADAISCGLAVFDEHNTEDNYSVFQQLLGERSPAELPPFRVFDAELRRVSLTPAGTGLILFNLCERRIVQIQNSYVELLRSDRGRIWQNGRPTTDLYRYRLPADWRIVP